MLKLNNISKIYETEGFKQKALNNVSVCFRDNEFTSILGPSGSGKTTLLNIIGGLDHYTSGDLVINGVSTKKFNDSAWDSYRNHRIGFVFQSYNLISHQTILSNVMLALTLSGISKKESMKRAKKALKDVGLENHMNKKPSQLSGGQMQRVAIARALVNDPDILLADEPTGALDSETSVQIMKLLKKISKNKLVIMVTHNPELANIYSNRIITLKDGVITSDSNAVTKEEEKEEVEQNENKSKKTSMSFFTALSLSFNNLMTKKGRTVLVAFAGSIGIIGIALILAVSTGFQNYVDYIQEDTLTSYPLTIMQESTDITSMLLSMRTGSGENNGTNEVREQQYISNMLSSIKANDLKSFRAYLNKNYNVIEKDIANINYSYSVDPMIYTYDATNKLAKLNPNNMFSSMMGGSNLLSSYSSFSSIFSQMVDDRTEIETQYDVLAGRWPQKYNEMIIVLSEANTIPDLLVYSLGFRDNEELKSMITNIMSGTAVENKNEPLTLTYDDLLNIKMKLIMPSDTYKYNTKYKVYEDMSDDETFMKDLYKKSEDLKIVGIVTSKEGINSSALQPGVAYTSDLIKHIIDYSKNTEVVKKQLNNPNLDVFSNKKFDQKKNDYDFKFTDLVKIDTKKLSSAFNMKIDQKSITDKTQKSMAEISNSISTDITPAKKLFTDNLNKFIDGLFNSLPETFDLNSSTSLADNYLKTVNSDLKDMENKYVLPSSTYKTTYKGLLDGLLKIYISTYAVIDNTLTIEDENPVAKIDNDIKDTVVSSYTSSVEIIGTCETMAKYMTEALMKKTVLTKVGEITSNLVSSLSSGFKVDQSKISSAFKLNFSEDELARVVSAMMNKTETTQKSNLIALGYQDLEEPTFISFYFNSFDSKEHFISFLDSYNEEMTNNGEDDKTINYSDTTGILMGSVKTIVNAVSYVLIAFVSISLVVSSIMIGIITYISVYERTKEIGILRSIGASKRNISSIFNAETFIIGMLSGIFGIGLSYILIPIINAILHHYTGNIPLAASLEFTSALKLVGLSIILTIIGGLIPASSASKKDPVEALRSE